MKRNKIPTGVFRNFKCRWDQGSGHGDRGSGIWDLESGISGGLLKELHKMLDVAKKNEKNKKKKVVARSDGDSLT
ncbi:GM21589 [Drosophila sechellia]|uniref:GM21589 n=1 Tax=Drosophila sechellia TaxID=7238 RepID=B4HRT3_DROSE|nr:GM21589 [Drosophila sechellia]